MTKYLAPIALVLLAGCSSASPDASAVAPAEAAPAVRFADPQVAAARAALLKEPAIVDFAFSPNSAVEWTVAVADDGSRRYGLAEYVCGELKAAGAYDDDVDVRIVDAAKRQEYKDEYRAYSLGAVRCRDGAHLD